MYYENVKKKSADAGSSSKPADASASDPQRARCALFVLRALVT